VEAHPNTKVLPLLEGDAEGIISDKVMPITKCPHPARKHYAKVRILINDRLLEHVFKLL
jgi:hypothetical protein